MISIRIVTIDYYMCHPIRELDIIYSEFRGAEIRQVPVIQIFGSTQEGQKTCVNIHGVFPYIYIPYDGAEPVDNLSYKIATELDKLINISLGQASANSHHVYNVSLVSGIPIYGYHERQHQFLKIHFYNPTIIKKACSLLENGAVLGKCFQPHESHINYILQFMIDFNLHGMSFLNLSDVKFRRNPEDMQLLENIPPNLILPSNIPRRTVCKLEVDALASSIVNRKEISSENLGVNPGLAALWEDEKQRRRNKQIDSQISFCLTQDRIEINPTATHNFFENKLQEKLNREITKSDESSLNSSVYPAEVLEDNDITNTPVLDQTILKSQEQTTKSQEVEMTENDMNLLELLEDLKDNAKVEDDSILSQQVRNSESESEEEINNLSMSLNKHANIGDEDSIWENSFFENCEIPQLDGDGDTEIFSKSTLNSCRIASEVYINTNQQLLEENKLNPGMNSLITTKPKCFRSSSTPSVKVLSDVSLKSDRNSLVTWFVNDSQVNINIEQNMEKKIVYDPLCITDDSFSLNSNFLNASDVIFNDVNLGNLTASWEDEVLFTPVKSVQCSRRQSPTNFTSFNDDLSFNELYDSLDDYMRKEPSPNPKTLVEQLKSKENNLSDNKYNLRSSHGNECSAKKKKCRMCFDECDSSHNLNKSNNSINKIITDAQQYNIATPRKSLANINDNLNSVPTNKNVKKKRVYRKSVAKNNKSTVNTNISSTSNNLDNSFNENVQFKIKECFKENSIQFKEVDANDQAPKENSKNVLMNNKVIQIEPTLDKKLVTNDTETKNNSEQINKKKFRKSLIKNSKIEIKNQFGEQIGNFEQIIHPDETTKENRQENKQKKSKPSLIKNKTEIKEKFDEPIINSKLIINTNIIIKENKQKKTKKFSMQNENILNTIEIENSLQKTLKKEVSTQTEINNSCLENTIDLTETTYKENKFNIKTNCDSKSKKNNSLIIQIPKEAIDFIEILNSLNKTKLGTINPQRQNSIYGKSKLKRRNNNIEIKKLPIEENKSANILLEECLAFSKLNLSTENNIHTKIICQENSFSKNADKKNRRSRRLKLLNWNLDGQGDTTTSDSSSPTEEELKKDPEDIKITKQTRLKLSKKNRHTKKPCRVSGLLKTQIKNNGNINQTKLKPIEIENKNMQCDYLIKEENCESNSTGENKISPITKSQIIETPDKPKEQEVIVDKTEQKKELKTRRTSKRFRRKLSLKQIDNTTELETEIKTSAIVKQPKEINFDKLQKSVNENNCDRLEPTKELKIVLVPLEQTFFISHIKPEQTGLNTVQLNNNNKILEINKPSKKIDRRRSRRQKSFIKSSLSSDSLNASESEDNKVIIDQPNKKSIKYKLRNKYISSEHSSDTSDIEIMKKNKSESTNKLFTINSCLDSQTCAEKNSLKSPEQKILSNKPDLTQVLTETKKMNLSVRPKTRNSTKLEELEKSKNFAQKIESKFVENSGNYLQKNLIIRVEKLSSKLTEKYLRNNVAQELNHEGEENVCSTDEYSKIKESSDIKIEVSESSDEVEVPINMEPVHVSPTRKTRTRNNSRSSKYSPLKIIVKSPKSKHLLQNGNNEYEPITKRLRSNYYDADSSVINNLNFGSFGKENKLNNAKLQGIGELLTIPILQQNSQTQKINIRNTSCDMNQSQSKIYTSITEETEKTLNSIKKSLFLEENSNLTVCEEFKICSLEKAKPTLAQKVSDINLKRILEDKFLDEIDAICKQENKDTLNFDTEATIPNNLIITNNTEKPKFVKKKDKKFVPVTYPPDFNINSNSNYSSPEKEKNFFQIRETLSQQYEKEISELSNNYTKMNNLTVAEKYDLQNNFAPQPCSSKIIDFEEEIKRDSFDISQDITLNNSFMIGYNNDTFNDSQKIFHSLIVSDFCEDNSSKIWMPKYFPPSPEDIKNSLTEYNIPENRFQEPFYSNYSDVTKKIDVGHNVLKILSKSAVDLDEFQSSTGFSGLEKWRKEQFQNLYPATEICKNLRVILAGHSKIIITPCLAPPTKKEVILWLQTKIDESEIKFIKNDEKSRIVIPSSPGNSNDSFNESFTLSPLSQTTVDVSQTPPSSQRISKKGNLQRKALFSQTKLKFMLNEENQSSNDSCQITGVSLNNTHGFQLSFENLQNAKAVSEHQHLTILVVELHIRTRGEFYPDPQYDSIRAIFYSILNDVPENFLLPREETGIIVVDTLPGSPGEKCRPILEGTGINCEINYVKSELELIEEFIKLVRKWDPDILTGFEIEMLSWGYLIERSYIVSINLPVQISRTNPQIVKNKNNENQPAQELKLTGRIILDAWRLFKHEIALQSYTFENLMYHILHKRIPAHSFKNLSFWWEYRSNYYRHITANYYIDRVQGVLKLLDQLDLIGRTCELARLFGIQFFEVLSRGSQFRVESMMLRLAKPLNFISVSPSVQQRAKMRAPEWIPLIFEPESRFYTDPVIVLDFQSLYPSIIIAYNYCFSTCIGRIEKLGTNNPFEFGACQLKISRSRLRKLENKLNFSPCGVGFVKQEVRKGILPRMLQEILETRLMVKQSMKQNKEDKLLQRVLHSRQLGLKLIANVTYGYTAANFSGRMPCSEVGDSVVSKGRETLERAVKTIEQTEKWRARVIYGDTDSLFVLVSGRSRQEAFKIGEEIAEVVTNDNPSPVKLKLEKIYQPCILQTKKRYVGYMYESADQKDPEYNAKGIETVRRDGCPAVAKMLEKSLRILFDTRDMSLVKRYVCRQFDKLISGRVSIQDLVFAKEYRGANGYRPGACVPALELARKWTAVDKRREPRRKERVPYIVVHGPPGVPLIRLVRCPRELLNSEQHSSLRPNAIYYITRVIAPPLNRCFSLIGADVQVWFQEMPRKQLQILPTDTHFEKSKKSTISQYFSTMSCIVCNNQTRNGLCEECYLNPQYSIVVLQEKLRGWEQSFNDVKKICESCCSRTEFIDCISLDCPILYRLNQLKRDLKQVPFLRNLILKFDLI